MDAVNLLGVTQCTLCNLGSGDRKYKLHGLLVPQFKEEQRPVDAAPFHAAKHLLSLTLTLQHNDITLRAGASDRGVQRAQKVERAVDKV